MSEMLFTDITITYLPLSFVPETYVEFSIHTVFDVPRVSG